MKRPLHQAGQVAAPTAQPCVPSLRGDHRLSRSRVVVCPQPLQKPAIRDQGRPSLLVSWCFHVYSGCDEWRVKTSSTLAHRYHAPSGPSVRYMHFSIWTLHGIQGSKRGRIFEAPAGKSLPPLFRRRKLGRKQAICPAFPTSLYQNITPPNIWVS